MRNSLGDMLARRLLFLRHARGPLGGLALVALCLTVYVPGFFTIPPVDRDESRFAQASRQMFESVALPEHERNPALHAGGLAVPMVADKPRLNKPPLIYWLQGASAALFTRGDPLRDAIWMYRVPSLLAGLVTVLATWRLGLLMFDPRAAWLGAALLAVAPVFVWEAHQARADMVLVAWTVLAMGQLFKIWKGAGRSDGRVEPTHGARPPSSIRRSVSPSLLLWLFTTLGILTKGPITPMVVILTALALSIFSRDWRWLRALRPLLGLVIITAGVAPWVFAVARQVGFDHYWSIIYDEVFVRAGSAKEGHWGPPGYHTVLLVVLFWPGSLLTALAVARAFRRATRSGPLSRAPHERAGERATTPPSSSSSSSAAARPSSLRRFVPPSLSPRPEAFLLAWTIPAWLVFELVGTKLPHYTMPLYPAIALITARATFEAAAGRLAGVQRRTNRIGFAIWCIPALLISAGLGVACYSSLGGHWHDRPPVLPLASLQIVSIVATAFAIASIRRRRWLGALSCGVVVSLCLSVGLLGAYLPRVQRVWFTNELITKAATVEGGPLAASGFQEDSLVYLTRGRIEFVDEPDEGAWWNEHPQGVMILPWDRVLRLHTVVGDVEGLRYTKGRVEQLAIVKRWWPPAEPRP